MPEYAFGIPFPVLARYDIPLQEESILGQGGMGIVFLAKDRLLDKDVAIKIIQPALINRNTLHESAEGRLFFREAMSHARLGVEYRDLFVRVNNYGIEDDTPFYEMEILRGGSLRARMSAAKDLKRRGPLFDESTIKDTLLRVGAALQALHSHKVYHSDLKPENILFTSSENNDLKIADLGLARIAQSGLLTRAGLQTFHGGTMNYTPQAVLEGRRKASQGTDIYSAGVILFEMLTGDILLWGQANRAFVSAHPSLSAGARDIIIRACRLLGRNNFNTIGAFMRKLEKLSLVV